MASSASIAPSSCARPSVRIRLGARAVRGAPITGTICSASAVPRFFCNASSSSSSSSSKAPLDASTPADLAVNKRTLLAATAAALGGAAISPDAAHAVKYTTFCEVSQTSDSGIQFCDAKVGSGGAPSAGTAILCNYTGRLASNGLKFDSSYDRNSPLKFKIGVGQVIKGWDEGILGGAGMAGMQYGGKRTVVIPSALGYGTRGAGGVIPPNADLIFDIELLGPA